MKQQPPPRKLTRSRDDRYIGGVAAGIGKYLNVDPVFVRIAFVASLALGGLGLLAYVALLAFTPLEGDPSAALPPIETKRRNQMIGLAVVVGVLALFTADSGAFAAWFFGFWPGTVFGILFWVAVGAGLAWLLANGNFSHPDKQTGRPEAETGPGPAATAANPETSTELETYAESPTQLSRTEVMETRQMDSGASAADPPERSGPGSPGTFEPAAPVRDHRRSAIGRIILWFALGLGGLIVFSVIFVISASTTALFGGVPMAVLVILLGGGMVFAGLRGRRQLSLWLLTAAIAVTIPMAAVSIADLRIEGNYGDVNEAPLSVLDIPEDGYKMAAGNMTIDLRKLDFERFSGDHPLRVRSGMGLTSVIVPDRLCVTGEVEGKAGVISFRGKRSNGIDVGQRSALVEPSGRSRLAGPEIRIDGEFKLGAFEVVDSTQWQRFGRGGSFDSHEGRADNPSGEELARERASAACSEFSAPEKTGTRS